MCSICAGSACSCGPREGGRSAPVAHPRGRACPKIGRTAARAPSDEIGDLTRAGGPADPAGRSHTSVRDRRPQGTQIGPTEVERKTTAYPPPRKGVKTGPQRRPAGRSRVPERLVSRKRARPLAARKPPLAATDATSRMPPVPPSTTRSPACAFPASHASGTSVRSSRIGAADVRFRGIHMGRRQSTGGAERSPLRAPALKSHSCLDDRASCGPTSFAALCGATVARVDDLVRLGLTAPNDGRGRTPPRESGIRPRPGRASGTWWPTVAGHQVTT
jgi:hypothetical protein